MPPKPHLSTGASTSASLRPGSARNLNPGRTDTATDIMEACAVSGHLSSESSADAIVLLEQPGAVGCMVLDLASFRRSPPTLRSLVVGDIGRACRQKGFFQVVNHGIGAAVMGGALESAAGFFGLPTEDKAELVSDDVRRPVRCGSSARCDGCAAAPPQRSFLKQYAHPVDEWVDLWPSKPADYRENMGRYAVAVRMVALELMEAIVESLGLGRTYLKAKLEDGVQVMVVNSYATSGGLPEAAPPMPVAAVVMPPHTDYSYITVLLQSGDGLQVMDADTERWSPVPAMPGALYVQVGNHLEVLSNGRYRSAVHRAVLDPSAAAARMSVASLHCLAMGEVTGVAAELMRRDGEKRYRESSFEEFLEFLSWNELGKGASFIDTLRLM